MWSPVYYITKNLPYICRAVCPQTAVEICKNIGSIPNVGISTLIASSDKGANLHLNFCKRTKIYYGRSRTLPYKTTTQNFDTFNKIISIHLF